MKGKVWMDGRMVDFEDAKVHVLAHGLHYGTGVFEGIRVYHTPKGRNIFRLRDHMVRFLNSAKVLQMDVPYSLDELCEACREVVRSAGPEGDYLRPLAFYGVHPEWKIGLNPSGLGTNVSIMCTHMGVYIGEDQVEQGAAIITSSWEKYSNRAAALNAKVCGHYVNSVIAKLEAIQRGCDEALLLNGNGSVAEGTGENVFMVKNGRLYTPPVSAGILEGITRDCVMTIAQDIGIEVTEKDLTRSELFMADEVFLTGTAAEISPVRSIDDRIIANGATGPMTQRLGEAFHRAAMGEDPRYKDWSDLV
ncbi:MAG TPA: branched-chain amino acid transaminase [Methanomassiliicoccales archaeon]|nr:branched-chain amino acid transaminase [Methanomassiliicoccales archaeon]HRR66889.1 branched-chain amino acid transaminase [Methanomassiliicoccales archaeon]